MAEADALGSTGPLVFISYAHDDKQHKDRVLTFARFLTERNIRVELDIWNNPTRQDWPAWITERLRSVDYVLVIASAQYQQVGDGNAAANLHRRVQFETAALRDLLYADSRTWLPKVLPVLLPGHTLTELPLFLQSDAASHFRINTIDDAGAEELLRVLTGQPQLAAPALDSVPALRPRDIVLTEDERYDLLNGLVSAFRGPEDAEQVMRAIRYPVARRPDFTQGMTQAWNQIFNDIENGILSPTPYATVLRASLWIYSDHPILRPIAERHGLTSNSAPPVRPQVPQPSPTENPESTPQDAATSPAGCHVIIRANNQAERRHAIDQLRELDLNPHEVWSTGSAVSYRLTAGDAGMVRERLGRTELGWTVVAPGEPNYLFQSLFIEGPDTRRFVVRDAPAQQTLSNLANEILADHYLGQGGASTPVTVDHVTQDGEMRRVDGDSTMHDAGVHDGDTLRVGSWSDRSPAETTAAAGLSVMPVTVYLSDRRIHAQVEAAVEEVLASVGFEVAPSDGSVQGGQAHV